MGFFDLLQDAEHSTESKNAIRRLNLRHRFLVDAFAADIRGADILTPGARNGCWR